MFSIVGGLVPAAIGVALSPAPLIELILVLFSKRARINGLVFVTTLVVSISAVAALVLAIALRNWSRRADTSVPKVFDTIANMGPGAVFLLAVGAVPLNPKNLVMVLAAGAQAGASGEPTATIVTALVVFTLLAASPFLGAIGYLFIAGQGAEVRLGVVRDWLMRNNRRIMAIVLAVLGLVIAGQGLAAVAG